MNNQGHQNHRLIIEIKLRERKRLKQPDFRVDADVTNKLKAAYADGNSNGGEQRIDLTIIQSQSQQNYSQIRNFKATTFNSFHFRDSQG